MIKGIVNNVLREQHNLSHDSDKEFWNDINMQACENYMIDELKDTLNNIKHGTTDVVITQKLESAALNAYKDFRLIYDRLASLGGGSRKRKPSKIPRRTIRRRGQRRTQKRKPSKKPRRTIRRRQRRNKKGTQKRRK